MYRDNGGFDESLRVTDYEKRFYKKIQDNHDSTVIKKLIHLKPDKIILVLSEKEAVSLQTACALVRFTFVSHIGNTKPLLQ